MKITKSELKKIVEEELEQVSEYGWNDLKVGDSVTMKNNKKAKVVKLGGKGFPKNFVKVKPSSGKEEVVSIDDLKESIILEVDAFVQKIEDMHNGMNDPKKLKSVKTLVKIL